MTDRPKHFDPEGILPVARQGTQGFKTGEWNTRHPRFLEKASPCRAACPVGQDIPRAISLVLSGDVDGALSVLLEENPLPGVTGRICYHPCQTDCNRAGFEGAVGIRGLERWIADRGKASPVRLSTAGADAPVAVIGSGPAGLSAAYHLARLGHPVTVFDEDRRPGGLLAQVLPEYRLPMEVVVREASRVFDLGVEFRGNHHVAIEDRFRLLDDYAAVFAAAGAGESRVLDAPGAESSGVVTALSFLKEVKRGGRTTAGRRVVVVGGGNVAVDAAMTAKRLGADRVDLVCLESRQDMPAHEWEIEDAAAEGVALHPGLGVRRVARTDSGAVVELARCLQVYDPDGLFCPVYGGEPAGSMEADLVVAAVGQTSVEPADDRDERILVGGDAASGPGSVAAALADGKRAAAAIHNRTAPGPRSLDPRQTRLGDLDAFSMRDLLIERPNYDHHRVVGLEEIEPIFVESRPPAGVDRRRPGGWSGFDEVRRTPSRAEALAEAERCLFCGTCTECGWCELFCPDLALRPGRPSETPARVDADHCKGCSVCVAVCRGRVLIMEDLG